jgi:hypothetical protein
MLVPETSVGCTATSPEPSNVVLFTVLMLVPLTRVGCTPVNVLLAMSMVLLVSVTALAAVKTLVGVMIPDSVAMFYSGCVGH